MSGGPLARLLDHLARTPDEVLATDYVATFDLSGRRHALHLTYFTTETPGGADCTLRFKQTYRGPASCCDDTELPDTSPSCWSTRPPSTSAGWRC